MCFFFEEIKPLLLTRANAVDNGRSSALPPQVCVRGSSPEGCVLQQLSCPPQQAACRALWGLMEQRSQLLFVHEYARRAGSASAYVSKLALLGERLGGPQSTLDLVNS